MAKDCTRDAIYKFYVEKHHIRDYCCSTYKKIGRACKHTLFKCINYNDGHQANSLTYDYNKAKANKLSVNV